MRYLAMAACGVAAAIGLASPASADEASFIDAIAAQGYYATTAPGTAQEAVDTGQRVCAALGSGGDTQAVQVVRTAYNGDTGEFADYHATLFVQAAAYNLCPEHRDEIGPV